MRGVGSAAHRIWHFLARRLTFGPYATPEVAVDNKNQLLFIAERGGNRVRVMQFETGIIHTICGTGEKGSDGPP